MTQRPRASLRRVLDDLGHTLLDLVHGEVDALVDVGGVVIYDALDEPAYPPRALVLGVGVHPIDDPSPLMAPFADTGLLDDFDAASPTGSTQHLQMNGPLAAQHSRTAGTARGGRRPFHQLALER